MAQDRAMQAGSKTHLGKASLFVDGATWSCARIMALFQRRIDAHTQVIQARAALDQAIAAEAKVMRETQPSTVGITQVVRVMFASSRQTLADFGIAPKDAAGAKGTKKRRKKAPGTGTPKATGTPK